MLTVAMLAGTVPGHMRSLVTQSLVDRVNALDSDPHLAEGMRENFVSCASVLSEGKFKLEDYTSAVKFVSYLMMKYTKKDAWARTFPERHQKLVAEGAADKTISAHVAMYSKGKLVNLITERTLIPFHVLNQDIRQLALMEQVKIMRTAKSDMVRTTAANSILVHLTPPKEVLKTQLNINVGESSSIKALQDTLVQLVEKQRDMIGSGVVTAKSIAASKLVVDAEVEPA